MGYNDYILRKKNMENKNEIKKYCMSCIYFTPINSNVGYCNMLGVSTGKEVAILDAYSTLKLVGAENEKIYNFIIIQSRFGCVCYSQINML
jgi:hypothetical protein